MHNPDKDIDAEAEGSRVEGHDNFIKLMRRLGVDQMTPEQRVQWIKNTDAKKILELLARANGKLASVAKVQRWTGRATKSVVGFAGTTDSPDLEPPENAEEQFIMMYEQMQKEINTENSKVWAAKLYAALIFAHMFPDGNGRTARHVYALLTQAGLPDIKISKNRGGAVSELCLRLGIAGMQSIFKKHGIEWNDEHHYATTDGISIGNMDFLKYLAAKKVLIEVGTSSEGSIELTKLSDEQKMLFEKRYAELRKEWFVEVIKTVDAYSEYVTEQLDAVIAKENMAKEIEDMA